MRFSCARCGQRYSSVDEPRAGLEYRVPCVGCGAVVLLKGADFPALPTAGPDPGAATGSGAVSDATGEEPLGLALGPMVVPQRATLPRGATRAVPRTSAPASRRWDRIAIGGGVALATVGAVLLLVLGGPSDARPTAPSSGSPASAPPGGAAPSPSPGPSPVRPVAPASAPDAAPGAVPQGTPPSPTAPAAASPARRGPPPPARRVASVPGPVPLAAAAPPPGPAGGAPAVAPPAPAPRPPSDQMVAEALAARRPAFESCVREWLRDNPGAGLSGRRVTVTLIVNPSGTVSASSLDDPGLENTALGACFRNVLGRPFPAFEGDPLQVVIPLRLGD